jgi:putative PIN family toxin of toxin-antitoxin system
MPLRFVMDTNVLVSALRSKRGASFELAVRRLDDPRIELQISNTLAMEYEEVLLRERARLGLSVEQVEQMLDGVMSIARCREVFFTWRPASKDPDDDFVIDLAVASGVSHVVSYNAGDLKPLAAHGIVVATPPEFLKLMNNLPNP